MIPFLCLFVAFFLASVVDAFAAWLPNCTTPTQHVNFVSNPQVRGTMDIIWTCFTVLSLCTWTIQHLMVPVHKEYKKVSAIRKLWGKVNFNYTKLKWVGVTIAAPEWLLGKALTECLAAGDSRRQFKEWCASNDTRKNIHSEVAYDTEEEAQEEIWTTAHGFFANMRGFVLRFNVAAVPKSLEPSKPTALGRSRQNPRLVTRDGDPPYHEQEAKKAEATELDHCRKICKGSCRNHPDVSSTEDRKIPAIPLSSPPYQPAELTSNTGQREKNAEVTEQPEITAVDPQIQPESLRVLTDQAPPHNLSPTGATAVTHVNSPDFSRHDVMAGLAPSTYALGPVMSRRIPAQQGASPDSDWPTIYTSGSEKLGPHKTWKGTWALSSVQLLYACQKGIISGPPELSTADLEDRSKGDIFVKGAAILQISWLVIQIIARASQGLAISLLEITTLAFAACAIATYILLWHKPQDVMTPTYIDATNILTRKQVIGLAARSPVSTLFVHEFWLHGVAIRDMSDTIFPWTRGIAIRLPRQKDTFYLNPVFIGIGFGGTLFGTIHFIAWNFEFPTPIERILWRLSCCVLISIPLLSTAIYFMTIHNARRDSETDTKTNALLRPFTTMCVVLYLLARLYLMTEVFRSLAYAPPNTEGNVVYGKGYSDWDESWSARAAADKITLLRGLLRGPSVDVFVGPQRAQISVSKKLLFHYSTMARRTFVQHGGDKHFKEFEENALYLPEHAPETFEFITKWMYQEQLGIMEYCTTIFATHDKSKEGLEAAFLLLCRVYILADYLDIEEIKHLVMEDLYAIRAPGTDREFSPIGPDAIKTVFRNTHGGSRLQIFVLEKLTESFVYNTNGRPIEEYTECFTAIEGFGPMIMKRVIDLSVDA